MLCAVLCDQKVGEITLESFLASSGRSAHEQLGNWEEIRQYFDTDRSGTIDKKEFVAGFQKWLLTQPIEFPQPRMTLQAAIDFFNTQSGVILKNLITVFRSRVQ